MSPIQSQGEAVVRATSDLHLSQRTAQWVFEALEALLADDQECGGTTVLVGDILDQADTVHMPTFNRFRDTLQRFRGEVYIVVGNHDQYTRARNALESLDRLANFANRSNVRVFTHPEVTNVGLMVPYQYSAEEFWSAVGALKKGENGTAKCWWVHQGWKGSYVNSMRRDMDGLSCNKVTAEMVISGHYHMPQNLGSIIYCGSPYETSFAEEGQKKGWLRWEKFPIGWPCGEPDVPERIAYNLSAPKHYTVLWDLGGADPKAPSEMRAGDRVRVVVNGTREAVKQKSRVLKDAGLEGASIIAESGASQRKIVDKNSNPQEAVLQYVNRVYGPDGERMQPANLLAWADEVGLWQS